MAETAAHLVDHVFPRLPVRQWVVSFPKWLRYFMKKDPAVLSAALGIVLRIIEQSVRACCPGAGPNARVGAVVFIHQFGSSLNEPIHFHIVVIDGVFEPSDNDAGVVFFEAMTLDESTLAEVQATLRRRVLKAFVRRGLLDPRASKSAFDRCPVFGPRNSQLSGRRILAAGDFMRAKNRATN
jgi:hypothetical protein